MAVGGIIMGLRPIEAAGFKRNEDSGAAWPEDLTIIGLDITEKDLLALFDRDRASDKIARAVIVGLREVDRLEAPTPGDVRAAEDGVDPVEVSILGPDKNGKRWAVVRDGRQSTMCVRVNNAKKKKNDRQMVNFFVRRDVEEGRATIGAMKSKMAMGKVVSLRTQAFRAWELYHDQKQPIEEVARILTRSDEDPELWTAAELLEWAPLFQDLCPEAIVLANRGALTLARAKRLAKLSHEDQDKRLNPPPKDKADKRPKAISAKRGMAIAAEAEKVGISAETIAAMRFFAGDSSALDAHPRLKKIVESAESAGTASDEAESEES